MQCSSGTHPQMADRAPTSTCRNFACFCAEEVPAPARTGKGMTRKKCTNWTTPGVCLGAGRMVTFVHIAFEGWTERHRAQCSMRVGPRFVHPRRATRTEIRHRDLASTMCARGVNVVGSASIPSCVPVNRRLKPMVAMAAVVTVDWTRASRLQDPRVREAGASARWTSVATRGGQAGPGQLKCGRRRLGAWRTRARPRTGERLNHRLGG
jgi:hypothetical protein